MPEREATAETDVWYDLRTLFDQELNRLPYKYRAPPRVPDGGSCGRPAGGPTAASPPSPPPPTPGCRPTSPRSCTPGNRTAPPARPASVTVAATSRRPPSTLARRLGRDRRRR